MPKRRIIVATSAETRLLAARQWLEKTRAESGTNSNAENNELLVLAPSRGAADELLRRACPAGGGLFGVHRATPLQLAAELATAALARAGLLPVAGLAVEALTARAISLCHEQRELSYFEPVAEAPGMARALAATIRELRADGTDAGKLAACGEPGSDLSRLLARYESELEQRSLVDDTALFELAREAATAARHLLLDLPLLLLDCAPPARAERRFLAAVVARAPATLATVARGDDEGRAAFEEILEERSEELEGTPGAPVRLERLRRHVFLPPETLSSESLAEDGGENGDARPDGGFTLFSAAGEGRECVEIARRIHALASKDVGFDQIAILLRDPDSYLPLVEEALRRAGIPAYFTRGTVRPDPAGRALLALLDCATEGLSASRFAEYLSLGQVPQVDDAGAPPEIEVPWVAPEGEQLVFKSLMPAEATAEPEAEAPGEAQTQGADAPVKHGTLRTPRGWERLLVDARVIGGLERWRQRLRGLEAELRLRIRGLAGEEQAREDHLRAQLERLGDLERFALPVIEALAELPTSTSWGEWLKALETLCGRVLCRPERVLTLLAELRPMDRVGPVGLDEIRRVLGKRLSFLRLEPPARRFGRVFVATVDEARGRSFDTVFLPGLAEGIFPRRALEDPLLLDVYRRRLDAALATQSERVRRERLLLQLAAGAARSRLVVCYPSLDVLQGRPRVPSFYALDLLRAAEGRIPNLRRLEARAAEGSQSLLGWPAPSRGASAIDDAEYDLSVLEPLLRHRPPGERGRGRFMLRNPRLDRSLRNRYLRWKRGSKFTAADGVVDPDPATLEGLAGYRLDRRGYSPTSLQRYAACPYRFLLYTVHGLKPRDQAVRLEQLDPLTRGSLFHEIQFELFSELKKRRLLSLEKSEENAVTTVLDETVDKVAGRYRKELFPAIDRVWRREIEDLHIDLRGWIRLLVAADETWRPAHFELGFGFSGEPAAGEPATGEPTTDEPLGVAEVAGGRLLRGRVDLVEENAGGSVLRVTDHKTGKSPKLGRLVVGGGKTLQPVLYALAMERLLGRPVESGRLSFCTQRGGYVSLEVPLDDDSRRAAAEVLGEIDHSVERGFLPAAPGDGECRWCDYQLVCGPNEESRIQCKHPRRLVRLSRLRSMP